MVIVETGTFGQELGEVTVRIDTTVEQPETPPTGVEPDCDPYQSLHVDEESRGSTGLAAARKLRVE